MRKYFKNISALGNNFLLQFFAPKSIMFYT